MNTDSTHSGSQIAPNSSKEETKNPAPLNVNRPRNSADEDAEEDQSAEDGESETGDTTQGRRQGEKEESTDGSDAVTAPPTTRGPLQPGREQDLPKPARG